jgi:peptidoglycan/LPS O-acetylase OafA/YrhL
LAATQVIVDHYFQHLNIPLNKLATQILYLFPGVPMFFVISGYLISASYERNNNLAIYFKNRALRIYPGLWGVIFITIIVFSVTGVNFLNKQTIAWLPAQLAGVIYTPHFLANYGFGSYNGSLWTLPIELQFYLILPICYFFAPKKIVNYWFYGLLAVFVILNFVYEFKIGDNFTDFIPKLISYSFLPYFYLFLAGVILQRLRIYKSRFIYNKALFWFIGYVAFSMVLPGFVNPIVFLIIKNLLLAFCILSLAYTLPQAATKLLRTNDISYGIYIYHGLILTVMVQLKLIAYENLFLLIALTYGVAWLSWIFIEKPFIKRKEKTIRSTV